MRTRKIISGNLDIISIGLMPVYHLLGAFDALGRIVFAPDRRLRLGDGVGGGGPGDFAFEALHKHVRLATAI